MALHRNRASDPPSTSVKRPPRASQACLACVASKRRCQGGIPCARCLDKNLACQGQAQPRASSPQNASAQEDIVLNPASDDVFAAPMENCLEQQGADLTRIRACGVTAKQRTPLATSVTDDPLESIAMTGRPPTPPMSILLSASDTLDTQGGCPSALDDMIEGLATPRDSCFPTVHRSAEQFQSWDSWEQLGLDSFSHPYLWLWDRNDSSQTDLDCFSFPQDDSLSQEIAPDKILPQMPLPVKDLQDHPHSVGSTRSIASSDSPECPNVSSFSAPVPGCPLFPQMQPEDEDVIVAESFGHVTSIPSTAYNAIRSFYEDRRPTNDSTFPSKQVLQIFVQLYFEHFDSQFPFLHPSTLEQNDVPEILVLAVAAVGCQYSAISYVDQYAAGLQELLQRAVAANMSRSPNRKIALVQSILLLNILLMFHGLASKQLKLQHERNMAVTLCRGLFADNDTTGKDDQVLDANLDQKWRSWVYKESRNRLMHSIFRLECLQLLFFNLQPLFGLSELPDTLPCEDSLWYRRTADEWHAQSIQTPTNPTRLNTLLSSPDGNEHSSPVSTFSQRMQALYLYVEERIVLGSLRSSPLCQQFLLNQPNVRASNTAPAEQRGGNPASWLADLTTSVDRQFRELCLFDFARPEGSATSELYPHLFSILRQVDLKTIYSFSGWQANEREIEAAKRDLRSWMRHNPASARMCLCHAVKIFSTLRSRHHFAHCDPFCLLISTLFIWSFNEFVLCELSPTIQETSDGREPPSLRLDRLVERRPLEEWIQNGGNVRIHIMGVGPLNGRRSSQRLLMECRKILLSRSGWSGLCCGIANAIAQILRGERPSLDSR